MKGSNNTLSTGTRLKRFNQSARSEAESPFSLPSRRPNRRSGQNSQDSETNYSPAGITRRPTSYSEDSQNLNPYAYPGRSESSLSATGTRNPKVLDWNEKLYSADPPRPAKDGFEWVWFPDGYWAERETPGAFVKESKISSWFSSNVSPQTTTNAPSTHPKHNSNNLLKGPTEASTISQDTKKVDEVATPTMMRRSMQYMSPTHPHFTAPNGDPEGLFCRIKREVGGHATHKKRVPIVYSMFPMRRRKTADVLKSLDDTTKLPAIKQTPTMLILEGTSQHLNNQQEEEKYARTYPASEWSPGVAATNHRPQRGFGLAPWHRKKSQGSMISVTSATSSVHKLLMGRTPAATPRLDRQYTDQSARSRERRKEPNKKFSF
jgi:parafibromin